MNKGDKFTHNGIEYTATTDHINGIVNGVSVVETTNVPGTESKNSMPKRIKIAVADIQP